MPEGWATFFPLLFWCQFRRLISQQRRQLWSCYLLGLITCRYTPRINSKKFHCNMCVETVQWQKPKKLRRWIQKWYVWSLLEKKLYAEKLWYDRFWLTYQWTLPTMHFFRSRKLFIEIYPLVYPQNQKMAYFQRQKTQCGTMSIFFNIDSSESSYHVLSWFQMSMSTYSSYIVNYALTFGLFWQFRYCMLWNSFAQRTLSILIKTYMKAY